MSSSLRGRKRSARGRGAFCSKRLTTSVHLDRLGLAVAADGQAPVVRGRGHRRDDFVNRVDIASIDLDQEIAGFEANLIGIGTTPQFGDRNAFPVADSELVADRRR